MADTFRAGLNILASLQRSLGSATTLEDIATAAASGLGESLQLRCSSVEIIVGESLETVGRWGAEPDDDRWRSWLREARKDLSSALCFEQRAKAQPPLFGYSFPLLYLGRPVGLIVVCLASRLGEAELADVSVVAQTIGSMCSLLHLRDQLALQTTEYTTLVEVGKALSSNLDLEDLLPLVADTAVKLTHADTATILLLEDEEGDAAAVRLSAVRGLHEREMLGEPDDADDLGELGELAGEVIRTQGALVLRDAQAPAVDHSAYFADKDIGSFLALPLSRLGRVLGVLALAARERDAITAEDLEMARLVADQAGVALENARLYGDMQGLYVETIRSLAFTLEAKDKYTRGHSDRVTEYAVAIADRMGFPEEEISILRFAGILHDIGKIAISEEILNKPGKLTALEREVIETHPVESARIIRPIGFLKDVVPIVEHHHEWFDGSGYNSGLAAEEIPKGARVLSVADAFEAMTSDRPYHGAMPWTDAVAELKRYSGTQFDPEVVDVFVGMILESVELVEGA
jgi:putative nucleotidyltransferase with HDIG domain